MRNVNNQTTSQATKSYGSQTTRNSSRPISAQEILKQGRSVPSPKASPGQFSEVLNPTTSQSVVNTPSQSYNLANDRGHYIRQKIQRDLKEEAAQQATKRLTRQVAKQLFKRLAGPASLLLDAYELYDLAKKTDWRKKQPDQSTELEPRPTGSTGPTVPANWIEQFTWSDAVGAAGGSSWQYRDVGHFSNPGSSSQIIGDPGSNLWSNIGSDPKYRVRPDSTEITAVGPHGSNQWGVNGHWHVPANTTQPGGLRRPRQEGDIAPDTAPGPNPAQRPGHSSNPDRRRQFDQPGRHPYAPSHGPLPTRVPSPTTDPRPSPAGKPRPIAPPMIIGGPGTLPKTNPKPDGHNSTPPGPGEKERKTIANPKSGGLVSWAVGTVTESIDFIEALHDALPDDVKRHYYKDSKGKWRRAKPSASTMLKDLYKNFDKLDLNEALKNVIINQLQDAIIGKLGARAQKEAKPFLELLGRPVGFGTGPAI